MSAQLAYPDEDGLSENLDVLHAIGQQPLPQWDPSGFRVRFVSAFNISALKKHLKGT